MQEKQPGDRLDVEVLGPFRVLAPDGCDITPPGHLPRRLLALLVLRRGRVVSMDLAIEALWPSERPADPVAALHNHVFRLRRELPAGLVESAADGYRLHPEGVEVDADRLRLALSAEASAAPEWNGIEAILQRWHGPAYAELDDVDEARAEAAQLEELRTRARESLAEARLGRGELAGLVADLTALADEQPLRERPRELLMNTLAATGRHAEALRVFDDFRRLLGGELGIEPSPALAALHQELLAPTATTASAPAARLPQPTTSLIGRDAQAAEVTAAVGASRLVTLVGPGGVGKTRLLMEAGHRMLKARPERPVILCELSRADAATAVGVVAAAAGIDDRPGTPLVERLASVLGDTEMVVLLDNCEHVLDPIAELAEHLLRHCPHLSAMATSRERLRLPGEQVHMVSPLPVGDATAPATELFLARALAVAPSFAPSEDELGRIRQIVSRLDGLPLAIELAAARMHTHDLEELAAGIDQRFELLSLGYRTSERHGSLTAAVSWSYRLLDEDLQRIFADLSVCAGPFDVVKGAAVSALDVATAHRRLDQLVERSLVMRTPGRRYVQLETLRAFGAEQLRSAGRMEQVCERHARHMVDWAEEADRRLTQPGIPVLAEIDSAVPELHRALSWLLEHDERELAGRLLVSLLDYAFMRLRPDVLTWAEQVTAADPEDHSPHASQVWAAAAYGAWMAGDVPEAGIRATRALQVAARSGSAAPPQALAAKGAYELFVGRLEESASWYRRAAEAAADSNPGYRSFAAGSEVLARGYADDPVALDLAEALLARHGAASTPHAAYLWYCAGEADLALGNVDRARSRFEQAMQLAEQTNARFVTGVAGASKVSIDARFGDPGGAARDYRKLIHHWRRAGMWSTQWTMLRSIAVLLDRLGRQQDAAVLEGALRAASTAHAIFGADEIALDDLATRLRDVLGDEAYEAARRRGSMLDRNAAAEHALRAL